MTKNKRFIIIFVFFILNCLVYPIIIDSFFVRAPLFGIAGIVIGYSVFYRDKNYRLDNIFFYKSVLFLFLVAIYYTYQMETDIMIGITRIRSLFCEIDYNNEYPLVINFFIESCITSSALLSYVISYFSFGLTLFVLDRSKNSNSKIEGKRII